MATERELPEGTRVSVMEGDTPVWAGHVHGYRFNFLNGRREVVIVPDESTGTLRFMPPPQVKEEGSLL